MNQSIKRIAIISMLTAMAIALSYAESFIPLPIPGFKLGLANVIVLIMLYEFHWYEALGVNIIRILIVATIRGTLLNPVFFMSLAGGIASYLIMLLISRIKLFSPIGASVLGAMCHVVAQIGVAMIIMSTTAVIYYLPFIGIISLGTGVISGIIARTYLLRSVTPMFLDVKRYVEDDIKKIEEIEENEE